MPPLPHTVQQRARRAMERIEALGGGSALPGVLTSHDAIACMGRTWFHDMLRCGRLPGVQVVPQGVWRCDRDTFVEWLMEVSHGSTTAMDIAERSRATHATAARVAVAARSSRTLPRHRRNDAGVDSRGRVSVQDERRADVGGARGTRSGIASKAG